MSAPVGGYGIYGELATGGWGAIGVTASTQATGTLTLSSNAVAGETVTIGPRRYTWATSANTQTPNVVKVGADASTSIDNLIAAINGTAASQGSLFSFNTVPSAQVSAAQGAGDTMVVTALAPGPDGNSVATTETMSGGAWGAVTLTGGTPGSLLTSQTVTFAQPTVTRHSILLDSGGTAAQIIPTGAKGYGFTVVTGTASDGTASGLPAGLSQSDANTLAAGFTVTASGGTTFVYWNT